MTSAYTPKAASSYDDDAALSDAVKQAIEKWRALPDDERNGERPFIHGFNAGWDEAVEQGADTVLAALPTSDASERLREARIANPVVVVDHVTHERGTEMWSEVITDRAHNNQVAHCADKEDAELIAHLINAALSNNEVSDDK